MSGKFAAAFMLRITGFRITPSPARGGGFSYAQRPCSSGRGCLWAARLYLGEGVAQKRQCVGKLGRRGFVVIRAVVPTVG